MKSMTGYGQGQAISENGLRCVSIEIKTVNHRYFTPSIRLDHRLAGLENELRHRIEEKISRGKIDVFIHLRDQNASGDVFVNVTKAKAYVDALKSTAETLGLRDDISAATLLRIPDLFDAGETGEVDEELEALAYEALDKALATLNGMREREGRALAADMVSKVENLRAFAAEIAKRAPEVVSEYRAKLSQRLSDYAADDASRMPDPVRIAQEVTLFADRACIDEELTRLKSHFAQFDKLIAAPGPVGKQLDFLVQELNRETNTIASKSNNLEITQATLGMKNEIEKIREQIQNLE